MSTKLGKLLGTLCLSGALATAVSIGGCSSSTTNPPAKDGGAGKDGGCGSGGSAGLDGGSAAGSDGGGAAGSDGGGAAGSDGGGAAGSDGGTAGSDGGTTEAGGDTATEAGSDAATDAGSSDASDAAGEQRLSSPRARPRRRPSGGRTPAAAASPSATGALKTAAPEAPSAGVGRRLPCARDRAHDADGERSAVEVGVDRLLREEEDVLHVFSRAPAMRFHRDRGPSSTSGAKKNSRALLKRISSARDGELDVAEAGGAGATRPSWRRRASRPRAGRAPRRSRACRSSSRTSR